MKMSKKALISLVVVLLVAAGGGAYLYLKKPGTAKVAESKGAQAKVQYTCSMHPFIVKDSPGTCPICGMELIKKMDGAGGGAAVNIPGHVALSASQQVMANVATVEARQEPLSKEVAAVGIVQYDQSRQAKVTAWVAGRVDTLYVNRVGDYVSAGRPVASVYSPDLVSAQQEYLLALRAREQFRNSTIDGIAGGGESLVASARQRLKLLGVKDAQLAALEKGNAADIRLDIFTPVSGVVIEKMVQQGQYVNMGEPLFSVADLSSVWVELEVYENEFPFVKIGQRVDITSQSYPGKTFTGTVSYIYPFLDPKTRTVKARVTLPNPGMKLKPDMFVNAMVKSPLGTAVVVPVASVIDTGSRQVAWVETKPGIFEPREVKVGARVGDKVQVLSGLKPGEKIAASGGYLIDSESQLNGPPVDHSQHTGQKPAPGAPAAPPKPGKKNDLDMSDMKM
ncbi:MAG TPA: efflux RND transporter periplasmic adaptor subunit [Verrucomicrobiae bacterium]|nr:efflux RND transporter periplasmic adaptor subunit [Verrucomicrobiae bacterium]